VRDDHAPLPDPDLGDDEDCDQQRAERFHDCSCTNLVRVSKACLSGR
jgi:hypothetical protein